MKKLILVSLLAMALFPKPSFARAVCIGSHDDGVFLGQHYFSFYVQLDKGKTCSFTANGERAVVTPAKNPMTIAYNGPAGYSTNVCQINGYAPVKSGLHQNILEVFQGASPIPNVVGGCLIEANF